jgi:hypothetical protein
MIEPLSRDSEALKLSIWIIVERVKYNDFLMAIIRDTSLQFFQELDTPEDGHIWPKHFGDFICSLIKNYFARHNTSEFNSTECNDDAVNCTKNINNWTLLSEKMFM